MDELLINIISVLITGIMLPLITVAGKSLIDFINQKKQQVKEMAILAEAANIITNVTKCIMQTYVENLKKEGKFDKDAQLTALNMAKLNTLNLFSKEIKRYLESSFTDIDSWLTTMIESAINSIK